jgi:assimilatory nitrate reductase catalytic subunit
MSAADYESFAPTQWPAARPRLFGDGRFATSDGRARMHAVAPQGPAEAVSAKFPLSLNTGRIRDHWHTMTRTALVPGLCRHAPEPYVDIHPADATRFGLADGKLARVETERGEAIVVARVTDAQRPGALFMPLHWTDAFAPKGRANAATAGPVDPRSGQPEFKHTPARISGYRETWAGFFIARDAWAQPPGLDLVWRRIPHADAQLHEFAGRGDEAEREALRRALTKGAPSDSISLHDPGAGSLRVAYLDGGRVERVLCMGARLPRRDSIVAAFARHSLSEQERQALLFGGAIGGAAESDIVCACASVGARRIKAAIAAGTADLDAIAAATRAGANCGSCRPEIRRLVAAATKENRHAA